MGVRHYQKTIALPVLLFVGLRLEPEWKMALSGWWNACTKVVWNDTKLCDERILCGVCLSFRFGSEVKCFGRFCTCMHLWWGCAFKLRFVFSGKGFGYKKCVRISWDVQFALQEIRNIFAFPNVVPFLSHNITYRPGSIIIAERLVMLGHPSNSELKLM